MKIAVFDVCGTLYNSNTTFDFLDWYLKNNPKYKLFRKLSKTKIGKILNYPFYKFLKKDLIRIIGTSFLKNKSLNEIQKHASIFVNEILINKQKNDVIEILEKYKKLDFEIILISGSFEFLIKEVAEFYNLQKYYATKLDIKNDIYSGKIKQDQLYDKFNLLKAMYPKIDELFVISDNLTDYPLLKEATKGIIICNKEKHMKFWNTKNLKNLKVIKHYD